jgi:hypothetical protein
MSRAGDLSSWSYPCQLAMPDCVIPRPGRTEAFHENSEDDRIHSKQLHLPEHVLRLPSRSFAQHGSIWSAETGLVPLSVLPPGKSEEAKGRIFASSLGPCLSMFANAGTTVGNPTAFRIVREGRVCEEHPHRQEGLRCCRVLGAQGETAAGGLFLAWHQGHQVILPPLSSGVPRNSPKSRIRACHVTT